MSKVKAKDLIKKFEQDTQDNPDNQDPDAIENPRFLDLYDRILTKIGRKPLAARYSALLDLTNKLVESVQERGPAVLDMLAALKEFNKNFK